ncbi:MAG: RDD family protein [Epsilonproteobacteria bacterium]|nr:RDD family protein [Campylobacterota bacterium]
MAKQRFRDIKQGKKSSNKTSQKKEKKQQDIPYATNGQKTKAALTDSFMLLMPIMYIVVYLVMGSREGFSENMLIGWAYILVPLITLQSLFMYFGNGQTPGYRAYDIRVVDSKTLSKPPLFSIVFRNMAMVLSLITFFGWLMMFFRKDKKGLHDLLSQTTVLYEKKTQKSK